MRLWEGPMANHAPPPRPVPAPAGEASYLAHAEACLALAATSPDKAVRALHEEECALWLMLARQRKAIDDVVQTYVDETDDGVD